MTPRTPFLLVALLAAACGSTAPPAAAPATTSTLAVLTTTTAPTATTSGDTDQSTPTSSVAEATPSTTAETTDLDAAEVALEVIATAQQPIFLTQRPGSARLTLVEREGTVHLLDPGSGEMSEAILDLRDETTTDSERGLLSVAYDEAGTTMAVYFTDRAGDTVVRAYDLDGDVPVEEGRVVLEVEQDFSNHNGGQVAFGPDGHLYVGLGDGGSGGDPLGRAQDTSELLGSILRLDLAGDPYAIPAGNAFVDDAGRPEILFYGARNPWRFSFDQRTGDLWIADVGQSTLEEVNLIPFAELETGDRNLGWNVFEGTAEFTDERIDDHRPPAFQYGRADGCSVTGGYVFRNPAIAELDGVYLFGDFCTSVLWGLTIEADGPNWRDFDIDVPGGSLGSFGQDLDGNVYVLSLSGQIAQVVAG